MQRKGVKVVVEKKKIDQNSHIFHRRHAKHTFLKAIKLLHFALTHLFSQRILFDAENTCYEIMLKRRKKIVNSKQRNY